VSKRIEATTGSEHNTTNYHIICTFTKYDLYAQMSCVEAGRSCGTYRENEREREIFKILIGRIKWNRPVGRRSLRWKGNNKIDFQGM